MSLTAATSGRLTVQLSLKSSHIKSLNVHINIKYDTHVNINILTDNSQEVKSDAKPEKGLFTRENDDGSLTRDLLVPKWKNNLSEAQISISVCKENNLIIIILLSVICASYFLLICVIQRCQPRLQN